MLCAHKAFGSDSDGPSIGMAVLATLMRSTAPATRAGHEAEDSDPHTDANGVVEARGSGHGANKLAFPASSVNSRGGWVL